MIGTWFRTDHDLAPTIIDLPVEITSGQDDGICIVDQVVRGTGIVGRITGDHGAVGLKVRSPGRPTRVTVVIHLDEMSTRWWSDRVRPPRTAPELPRLVLIRAQGKLRGAALLARPQGLRRAASAKFALDFDLTATELDGDGLLMVELAEPPRPAWGARRIAARSALGVRIDTISVRAHPNPTAVPEPVDSTNSAVAPATTASAWTHPESSANPPAGPASPASNPGSGVVAQGATGCDLALLPAGASGTFRLEVSAVPPAPPVPLSPANKLTRRRPARAGFKVLRAARRAGTRVLAGVVQSRPASVRGVHGFDLAAGVPVDLEVVPERPGTLAVTLAGTAEGPVLLGLDPGDRGLSCRILP